MPALSDLIFEAQENGYDVAIVIRQRDDGQRGQMTMPWPWHERSDNMLRQLGRWVDSGAPVCACRSMEIKYVREATAEDHAELPDLTERT